MNVIELIVPTDLQIRNGNRDNLGIIFHISALNIYCDPSFELSQQEGSNEKLQHTFLLKNKKKLSLNYCYYSF